MDLRLGLLRTCALRVMRTPLLVALVALTLTSSARLAYAVTCSNTWAGLAKNLGGNAPPQSRFRTGRTLEER